MSIPCCLKRAARSAGHPSGPCPPTAVPPVYESPMIATGAAGGSDAAGSDPGSGRSRTAGCSATHTPAEDADNRSLRQSATARQQLHDATFTSSANVRGVYLHRNKCIDGAVTAHANEKQVTHTAPAPGAAYLRRCFLIRASIADMPRSRSGLINAASPRSA